MLIKNMTMSIGDIFVWRISIICLKFKYNCPMKYDFGAICYGHDNLCPLFLLPIMHVTPKCKHHYTFLTASTIQWALLFIFRDFRKCNIPVKIYLLCFYNHRHPFCKPPGSNTGQMSPRFMFASIPCIILTTTKARIFLVYSFCHWTCDWCHDI